MKAVFMVSSTLVLLCWLFLLLASLSVVGVGGPSPSSAIETVVAVAIGAVTFALAALMTYKGTVPKTASVQRLLRLDAITLLLGLPVLAGFLWTLIRRLDH